MRRRSDQDRGTGAGLASQAVQVITDVDQPLWPGERTVVTIGAYDGVHLGHQAVIADVRRLAAREGARSVVLTFDRALASLSAEAFVSDILVAKLNVAAAVVGYDFHFGAKRAGSPPMIAIVSGRPSVPARTTDCGVPPTAIHTGSGS